MLKTIVWGAPDIAARYGGEEFIVILPETETKKAEVLAMADEAMYCAEEGGRNRVVVANAKRENSYTE